MFSKVSRSMSTVHMESVAETLCSWIRNHMPHCHIYVVTIVCVDLQLVSKILRTFHRIARKAYQQVVNEHKRHWNTQAGHFKISNCMSQVTHDDLANQFAYGRVETLCNVKLLRDFLHIRLSSSQKSNESDSRLHNLGKVKIAGNFLIVRVFPGSIYKHNRCGLVPF